MNKLSYEECLAKVKQIEKLTEDLNRNQPFKWDSMERALLNMLHKTAVHVRIEMEVQEEFKNGKVA